jgi:hypothetical protein
MELDSRKNESRTDMKKQDIVIEVFMHQLRVQWWILNIGT